MPCDEWEWSIGPAAYVAWQYLAVMRRSPGVLSRLTSTQRCCSVEHALGRQLYALRRCCSANMNNLSGSAITALEGRLLCSQAYLSDLPSKRAVDSGPAVPLLDPPYPAAPLPALSWNDLCRLRGVCLGPSSLTRDRGSNTCISGSGPA